MIDPPEDAPGSAGDPAPGRADDSADPRHRGRSALAAVGSAAGAVLAILLVSAVVRITVTALPFPDVALPGWIDLPGWIALPGWVALPGWAALPDRLDLPGWLKILVGPGKLAVLAVLVVLGALGELQRRRRGDGPGRADGPDRRKGPDGR